MKLPPPKETLAGCVWLPRLLAKARLSQRGALPREYEARLYHPGGVDGQFLVHFGLTREDILKLAVLDDPSAATAFGSLPKATPEEISRWNKIGTNLGRPGYPLEKRFSFAMSTIYKHLAGRGLVTVFEMLEADEENA